MSLPTSAQAESVIQACRVIAAFTETEGSTTRTYLSPPTRQVHQFLRAWMKRLGLASRVDAIGNLRGIYAATGADVPRLAHRLLIASHIDTVPNAGAFDGVLGVLIALALVEALAGQRLPYDIEVVAFAEEEGVRFGIPFLGSRALVGDIDEELLQKKDPSGISIAEAVEHYGLSLAEMPAAALHPGTFAYLEFHIEQGPVLEDLGASLGIVQAIAGQSRYRLTFHGQANHAGTTPMRLRHDALSAAAEWVLAVEREASATPGLVATVGQIEAIPGASNVIPGEVRLSLDVRHSADPVRNNAVAALLRHASAIAAKRGITVRPHQALDQPATPMHPALATALETAAHATGSRSHRIVSGAGHDAMVLAEKIPAAMLFLRSPGGISHHPSESVLLRDVQAALDAGIYFLQNLDGELLRTLTS